jgi:hypothetical protein
LIVGPPALADLVDRAGFDFAPGGEPPESEVALIREQLPVLSPFEASVLGNRELFGRLATTAMLPAMEQLCSTWRPDLILRDPAEYSSAVVAGRQGLGCAAVAISLAEAEAMSIAVAASALEEFGPEVADDVRRWPYLTRFPASLDPSPFGATMRYRDESVVRSVPNAPLPDYWPGRDGPLVYLTFGTVLGHMSMAADVYRVALDAVADLDARVLLTVGRHVDPDALGPVPDNVHVEAWVDQSDVLAGADLVVCHGGSGTVFGALAAGVPLVVVPVFADQFENGRRVEAAGAGLVVESSAGGASGGRQPPTASDTPRIIDAMRQVLRDDRSRHRAVAIGAEMAAAPTVDEVLERLLVG